MLTDPCWVDLDRTDPFTLQPSAPRIDDTQRSAVSQAEKAALADLAPVPALPDAVLDVVKSTSQDHKLDLQWVEGAGVEYWRAQGLLIVGRDASLYDVLHEAAHHAVSEVFPAHGVEWVNGFLGALRRHMGAEVAETYRIAFDEGGVHRTTEWQLGRVKKNARGKTNKERGAVARIVMDGPPEQVVCQLLEMHTSGLLVMHTGGEELLPFERIRYLACDLTDRSGRR